MNDDDVLVNDVTLTLEGAVVEGRLISWALFRKVLEALPQAAQAKLGWFTLMGPPSACGRAAEEAADIVACLFPRAPKEGPETGFEDA